MLENRMVIDSEWGESEYGVPLPRKRDKWEEEENDGFFDETFGDSAEDEGPEEQI